MSGDRGWALLLVLALLAVGLALGGRACRSEPPAPPPATATPTRAEPPMTATATARPSATATSTRPNPAATASSTPEPTSSTSVLVTATSTRANPTVTRAATPTPALLGLHVVRPGETMFGIGLVWYAGRYMPWGVDVWRPICEANRDVVENCRLIYVGQRLRIPAR